MNSLIVNSRKWFSEFRNGSTFATDTSVFSTYFKENTIERVKLITNVTISSFVNSSTTSEILFTDLGATATFTHPYLNWTTEGFKVGDTIRIINGVGNIAATISNISGTVLTCNDAGIAAALTIASGTSYPDLNIQNTTVPTSLVYQFGVVPNVADPSLPVLTPNPYASWLDGQTQSYKVDGITGSPTVLTGTMTPSAEITEYLDVTYGGVTDTYIFTFEIIHIFRTEFYKADWLINLINNNQPASFASPNSYRYINYMRFGTSASDTNEYRIFKDSALNGALGFVDNSYNNGPGNYQLVSIAYEDASANVLNSLEVTLVNTVTIQIEKTSGNFAAGQKAIVYVSKLPDSTEYSNLPDDWETTHVFDSCTAVDAGGAVSSDFIENLVVDVNASPQFLDITFDVNYSTAQKLLLESGDNYFIGVTVGDITLSAALSDTKCVWCDVNQYTKNSDIDGLISNLDFELYSSEKTPDGLGLETTNVDTWNNRLHMARVNFDLKKFADSNDSEITKMVGQVVFRNLATGESFTLDNYTFNLGKTVFIPVGGTGYQVKNISTTRDLNINSYAEARQVTAVSEHPGSFDANQLWTVRWPFVINWREWQANPDVPLEFFDNTEEQDNLNYRTSNYNVGSWRMYIRLLVSVKRSGIVTDYGLYSTICVVRDFDVQPDGSHTWTATTKIYDEDNNEVQDIIVGQDITIRTVFTEASVSGLSLADVFAEHTIEESGSIGDNFRLHSSVEWGYTGNMLKPLPGETYVKMTQDTGADTITVESVIDKDIVDATKSYNIYTHLQGTR